MMKGALLYFPARAISLGILSMESVEIITSAGIERRDGGNHRRSSLNRQGQDTLKIPHTQLLTMSRFIMVRSIIMLSVLLGIACSNTVASSQRANFTPENEVDIIKHLLNNKNKTITIKMGGLSGVTLKYMCEGYFDPIELHTSKVNGKLKLIEGIPSDFALRISSNLKYFNCPLFVTIPIKGITNKVIVVGFCVNDDGSLSPIDIIKIDRENGNATFSIARPVLIVWAIINIEGRQ